MTPASITALVTDAECDFCGLTSIEAIRLEVPGDTCLIGCDCAAKLFRDSIGNERNRAHWRKEAMKANAANELAKSSPHLNWTTKRAVRIAA